MRIVRKVCRSIENDWWVKQSRNERALHRDYLLSLREIGQERLTRIPNLPSNFTNFPDKFEQVRVILDPIIFTLRSFEQQYETSSSVDWIELSLPLLLLRKIIFVWGKVIFQRFQNYPDRVQFRN